MAALNEVRRALPEGFEGEVSGLSLADLIQLCVQSRFSGCIAVQAQRRSGLIFFRDGQIIHAEQGARSGDEAFYAIMKWTGGRFSLQPNVASTRSSIDKHWQFLLLEAHRLIDEEGAGLEPETDSVPPVPVARTSAAPLDRLRQISGVTAAVLERADGVPLGDDTHQAEVVAGSGLYLAMMGRQLGSIFDAGDIQSAAVEGGDRHLLLFAAAGHCLSVLVRSDAALRAVEGEVRRTLAGR
jgi:hypothetical protein